MSASLQSPNLDFLSAVSLVKSLREHLSKLRTDDNNFNVIYNEVVSVCQKNLISIPEVKKRKFTRKIDDNSTHYTVDSKIEEVRYFTFYPMLDEMIRGIDERFSQETLNLIASMGKMLKLQTDDADIKILSEAFNLKNIHTEIKLLINIPEIESICGSSNINISKWLDWLVDSGRSEIFSDFYKSLKLCVTIPVTSCSCERAFSKLTIVKSKLRTVMTQERLNALMLIFIEQHIATEIDLEDVIEEFKDLIPGKRRIEL